LYAQISKRKYAKVVKAKAEAVTTIRLARSIMVALDKAAKAEDRSRSWLIQTILVEGLKARGFLK
jgi:predicted transcriptional regulator